MAKLDSGLKFLAAAATADLADIANESALGVDVAVGGPPRANVLVEMATATITALTAIGFTPRTRIQNILTGDIPIDSIPSLEQVPGLRRAEVSRVLAHELDHALPESRVTLVHTGPPSHTGRGVIVGIIDSGIDYQHAAFRHPDGTSRILAVWDQRLKAGPHEAPPAGFNFGVEYKKADIDAALQSATPLAVVRHVDQPPFHGTHVSGIAAGNGEPIAQTAGALKFVGVAPDAELIVVANTRGRAGTERGLGDSADTLDALNYILTKANQFGRPVAINMSQGDNVGPHDGSSLLEAGITGLLSAPGQVLIKSAGNEGTQNRHAEGVLPNAGAQTVKFRVPPNTREVMLDLWYSHANRIDSRLTPPGNGSTPTATFTAPFTGTVTLSNGNDAFIDSDLNTPGNGDNRIFVILRPGSGLVVQSGDWTLQLTGTGPWHAWIQRHSASAFLNPFVSPASTISVPGTSTAVITVGAYVSNGANTGSANGTLSDFSSRGPTRDGRTVPTLAAPGEELTAPQPDPVFFGEMSGTSMASPMVTGTVALMLEVKPNATVAKIKQCLEKTARHDAQTGATPGNDWGAGKLDAKAAVACAGAITT